MNKFRWVVVVAALAGFQPAQAYKMSTHYDIATAAVGQSQLVEDPQILRNLGLRGLGQEFPSTFGAGHADFDDICKHSTPLSVTDLIACGAQFEDDPEHRAFNHFYDPLYESPLTVPVVGIGWVRPGAHLYFLSGVGYPNLTSPTWALQDEEEQEPTQLYSYRDARNTMYRALTELESAFARKALWGRLFQTLGQVVHHLQDMAQPQHVRNDQHIDKRWIVPYFNPSFYEAYTDQVRDTARGIIAQGTAPVYESGAPGAYQLPRDFWKNAQGTGIAEFTNKNFVSDGTNFDVYSGQQSEFTPYPRPAPGAEIRVPIEELDDSFSPQILGICQGPVSCDMTFISTNETVFNEWASSVSIYDEHVRLRSVTRFQRGEPETTYLVDRIYTLNRFNFQSGYPHLLPRAVNYTAGLINYFFRGKLEIRLPDTGLFGIVDHALENDKDIEGFHWIDVDVQNVTMRGTAVEPIEAGEATATRRLVAVVKFHRNNCHLPNLSGEYGSPGVLWSSCRGQEEEITVSLPADVPAGINAQPQKVRFNFLNVIPINASDVQLQVVYRGKLGAEDNAVIVATKDISEPVFVGHFDTHEQHYYGAGPGPWTNTFKEWFCDRNGIEYEACKQQYSMTCYAQYANSQSLLTPPAELDATNASITSTVPVSRFARVAILTDLSTAFGSRRCIHNIDGRSDMEAIGSLVQYPPNQFDDETGQMNYRNYNLARGVYVTNYDGAWSSLTSGDVPNPPLLAPTPVTSTITIPVP